MALQIQQVRTCDGACCKSSPRFPNADKSDCIYRTNTDQSRGCSLRNEGADLDGLPVSPTHPDITGRECFELTCLNWPHNDTRPMVDSTGSECCLQWVEV